ncbi:MAG: Wzt carbohydrate-binding domain-containing protein, partial [Acidobacteriota bacterium]|nr:Wzt carbohydrate-binding domain-containing protein [Acidobacteriota bacterium]
VDEALSVGDAYFQHKCIRRIREFKELGTTMLFVSHDPAAVKTLCDRALLLDQGRLVRQGAAEAILDYYNAMIAKREKDASVEQVTVSGKRLRTRSGDGKVTILGVTMSDEEDAESHSFTNGEKARIRCRFRFEKDLPEYTVGILMRDRLGNDVFGSNTFYLGLSPEPGVAGQETEAVFDLTLNLGYGHYSLTVAVHSPTGHMDHNHDWIDNVLSFQVIPGDRYRFAGVAELPVRARILSR